MTSQRTTDFSTLPPIMAVDFDGTLVCDDFPEIGYERVSVVKVVKQLQKLGVRTILWTSRTGKYLDEAVKWCREHDIRLDAINQNLPEVIELAGEDTRKVFADVYIDDRARLPDSDEIKEQIEGFYKWLGK